MWLDRLFSTVSYIEKPVFCEKHESVKDTSEEELKQCQEIFCVLAYIRKRVMDPFYYNNPYPSTVVGTWCENVEKLPWKSSITWDQLEEDMDLAHLVHDIATYTLAALTRVCVFCEKSKNSSIWVNNTKEDTDLWHKIKDDVDFKKALSCSSPYQKILDEIYSLQSLPSENSQFVDTIFFITFMIRYSVFSSESVESILASNQKIMEHTKKFTLEFPIGENHLKALEPLSQQLTKFKGAEKESFNILLELVKRAATSLKFKKYKAAEVYSHAVVTFVPSWCKGYYFLATAVYHNSEGNHYAHEVASHGTAVCDKDTCSTCTAFQSVIQKWQQGCGPMCHAPKANKLVGDEFKLTGDYKRAVSGPSSKKLISEADDVPELTDPSSSEESSPNECSSDFDYEDDEDMDCIKQMKSVILECPEVSESKHLSPHTKQECNSERNDSPVKKESPIKKEHNSRKNDSPVKNESPVRKVILEQKEISESKQQSPDTEQVNGLKENDSPTARQSQSKKQPGCEQNESAKPQPNTIQETGSKSNKTNSKKVEKARQRKESTNNEIKVVEVQEKMEHLRILLKEGSAAITDGCGLSAVRNFYDALSELKSSPDTYEFPEYEIVCIKYAYGSACIKSGTCEDLNKAMAVFTEILTIHPNVRFPVAYYGLGLVHFKLNGFKEALTHFEMLQSMLNKGIHCTVYSWPGTVHAIEETKTEKLKVLLNDLIDKCQSPPEPAAICRYEMCSLRPEIYYSDPDFKGFTIIQCQDRCILQYHPACWKSLKDLLDRTDKDFLGQQCLTPDCEFIVMQIECIGKDGTSEKHFEIEDPEKVKKHKKSRLEKRLVMKEQKKRRRLESQSVSVPENPDVCDNSEAASETASNISDQPAVKDVESNETIETDTPKKVESNLSVNAKPFYVKKDGEPPVIKDNAKGCYMWKKDVDLICENEKVSKTKERKKAKKAAALSLEEFRKKIPDFSQYNEYQMKLDHLQQNQNVVEDREVQWSTICETEKIPDLDPSHPFYIPEGLRDDPPALGAVLQSCSFFGKTDLTKVLKEKLYMHLENILSYYGPMRVDDSLLLEEISNLPSSFQKLISDAGGLKDFLLASMRFAFVGDHICIVNDVVKAYSLESKSFNGEGYSDIYGQMQEYKEVSNGIIDEEGICSESKVHSLLNPHAVEYNPYNSPAQSKSSTSSGNSNCSLEIYQNDFGVKEADQDSPIGSNSHLVSSANKLRESTSSNRQKFSDIVKNSDSTCEHDASVNPSCDTDVSYLFAEPDATFERLSEDIQKLPRNEKFDMFLRMLKFVLNDVYYAEFISSFGHHLKPYTFTVIPKRHNKCLQAGTPDINMHSVGVMKEDDHVKILVEKFHDLACYRNNVTEAKKVTEEKLERALDNIAQLQNALTVAEKNKGKKMEEVQTFLEEEKKEFRKKEKNWEKEQKRLELNQAKMNEQLKSCKEEIKKCKGELLKKDALLKETEEYKKATEINLGTVRKAKIEIERSLHEALQFHEVESSGLAKKLQDAQLEILTLKKSTVLEKISVATKNAELRLKEIQDGLPLVTQYPLYLDQLKSLQVQIKEYILKLGKIHCDFVKAANSQIEELKKGKDISDLEPLVEPSLSECPAVNPQHPMPNVGLSPSSLSPGNSQPLPNFADLRSLGLVMQAPNSTSMPSGSQMFSALNSFPQKLTTPQGINLAATPTLGNLPGLHTPHVGGVKTFAAQNVGMVNSSNLYDASVYSNAVPVCIQKPVTNFQQSLPRTHIPPGMSTLHPSSQGPNMFRMAHTVQQNTASNQPLVQSPFSFGFPQFSNKSELSASEKTAMKNSERSAAETAMSVIKNVVAEGEGKSPVDSKAHSWKGSSNEKICEIKRKTSNSSPLESTQPPLGMGSQTNSTSSSPVPVELSSRDKSVKSDSSRSTPVTVPELPIKPTLPFSDPEATGVKLKKPMPSTKQKMTSVLSQSGASSVCSDYDPFNFDGLATENSTLELGYTVKEHNAEASRHKIPPSPVPAANGFATAVSSPTTQDKEVPITSNYEKLLAKLMLSYPQYSREELIECVGEFRKSYNNKLTNMKFRNIINGIGKILEKRKGSLPQAAQALPKKKPQLQVISLTKKPAPAPQPTTEKSVTCPWAKPEVPSSSTPWHGNSSDTSCSICLEEMTVKSSVKKLECGHRFHTMCLKEWLIKNSNCPICRVHVLLPEDYPSLS